MVGPSFIQFGYTDRVSGSNEPILIHNCCLTQSIYNILQTSLGKVIEYGIARLLPVAAPDNVAEKLQPPAECPHSLHRSNGLLIQTMSPWYIHANITCQMHLTSSYGGVAPPGARVRRVTALQ